MLKRPQGKQHPFYLHCLLPSEAPPGPPFIYLKGLHGDGLGLPCGWLQQSRGSCGTHVL